MKGKANGKLTKRSESQRYAFIERVLYWRGWINRKDLMDAFGCSGPQATLDFRGFVKSNPKAVRYNIQTKRYEVREVFKPRHFVPQFEEDFSSWLQELSPSGEIPFMAHADVPIRCADAAILRALVNNIYCAQSVEVEYFSLRSGQYAWRRISPRTFGHDGLRWHVRAYCHQNFDFRDFVIGRIAGVSRAWDCEYKNEVDTDWVTFAEHIIRPHPDLSPVQQQAIAMDYGMTDGALVLNLRKALRVYSLRRLGFIGEFDVNNVPMSNETKQLQLVR